MPAAKVTSYYDALGLTRTCTPAELKKAYRKLSLKFHPERAESIPKAEAEVAFSEISEAYDVLSNPARRAIYDQYGERGLKEGIPDGEGGVKGGKYRFNNNSLEIFQAFFGTSSPFADILGATGEEPPSFYGELTGMQLPFSKEKATPVVAALEVTLAEIFNGATKTVSYTRKLLKDDGVTADEAVETQLYVKPGSEEGLIATLEGQGDQGVHVLPGDVEIELIVLPDLCARPRRTLRASRSMSHAPRARTARAARHAPDLRAPLTALARLSRLHSSQVVVARGQQPALQARDELEGGAVRQGRRGADL